MIFLDGGKGENIGLPPTNPNGAVMTPSGSLRLESHHQGKGAEPPADAFLKQAPWTKTAEHFFPPLLADDGANAKSEDGGPMHEATSIQITRPLNDTVFLVGHVVVAFDTRGFTPSADTPIEASLRRMYMAPRNHVTPASISERARESDSNV